MTENSPECATGSEVPRSGWRFPIAAVAGCLIVGLLLRYFERGHTTIDTFRFQIPWYLFARDHGVSALGEAFTNYTPFYSYLLLIAAKFDGLGQPLSLVKGISAVFELACAICAARIVWRTTQAKWRTSLAFCGVWLAPTVLFNGAIWGQSDSIWAFFSLLSVSLFMQKRNGVPPFAISVAVKAQGVFLGPLVLGIFLRRKLHWAWLATVPAMYVVIALPVLLAGRSLFSVLTIYLDQGGTFHRLTMNAASVWALSSGTPYAIGVPLGVVLAATAGIALADVVGRSKREDPEFILVVACASLLLMPFLLPKMHERYFYGFELASIILACINLRYLPIAVIAQIDGLLSFLPFEYGVKDGLLPAALCNALVCYWMLVDVWRGERGFRVPKLAWPGYLAAILALVSYLFYSGPGSRLFAIYLPAVLLAAGMSWVLMRQSRSP